MILDLTSFFAIPANRWMDEIEFLAKTINVGDRNMTNSSKTIPHICETFAL